MELPPDLMLYIAIGVTAQIIDGALGMAYGVTASSLLLGMGIPPAVTSATVHAAECFTTGASATSHHAFGNIDRKLFKQLLLPGVIGAAVGAYLLSSLPGDALTPWIAGYMLLMGTVILLKAFREFPPRMITTHLRPLGFFGALIDAIGGGGWGPIVASNLLARGNPFRLTVGTVNAVEFFVTLTASVVFLLTIGLGHWHVILGLALGGGRRAIWRVAGQVRPAATDAGAGRPAGDRTERANDAQAFRPDMSQVSWSRTRPRSLKMPLSSLSHLDRLEAESLHILREVAAGFRNPVMLYPVDRDSSVLLHLPSAWSRTCCAVHLFKCGVPPRHKKNPAEAGFLV